MPVPGGWETGTGGSGGVGGIGTPVGMFGCEVGGS